MKHALPALALTLATVAAPALGFTPERAAVMVDALRGQGCTLHGDQAETVLAPLGLEAVEVQVFVDTLYGAGLVTLSDDQMVLSLSEALCAAEGEASLAMITEAFAEQEAALTAWRPEFSPELGASFSAAVREGGCALTDENAADVLMPLGISPAQSRAIVTVLVDGGLASVTEDAQVFTLSEAFCAADPAGDASAFAALLAAWDETHPVADPVQEPAEANE